MARKSLRFFLDTSVIFATMLSTLAQLFEIGTPGDPIQTLKDDFSLL